MSSPLLVDISAYWNLNDNGSGGVSLVDSTGNGNALTETIPIPLGSGIIEGAADFTSASGNVLSTGSGLAPLASGKSYSGWVYFNNTPTDYQFGFAQGGTSDYQSVNPFYLESGGTVSSIFTTSDGSWTNTLFTSIVPDSGTWNHFCTTFTGTTATLYWNGSPVASSSYSGSISEPDTNYFVLGNFSPNAGISFPLDGRLDEVGVWNRALTSTEVTTLYNSGYGLTYPFAQLYFSGGDLSTLGNWWQDSAFTIPAASLPTSSDSVFISSAVTSGTATYASATIIANIGSAVTITATITLTNAVNSGTLIGTTTLNGTASNVGTITGTTTLNGTASNVGTITGTTTLNGTASNVGTITGTTTFNGTASNAGTITGNAIVYYPSQNPLGGSVSGTITYFWPGGTGLWGGDVWIDGSLSFIIPDPSDVKAGVEYGPAEDPYVGTYSGGGGSIQISRLLNLPWFIRI